MNQKCISGVKNNRQTNNNVDHHNFEIKQTNIISAAETAVKGIAKIRTPISKQVTT
jgi:hypothetical protein